MNKILFIVLIFLSSCAKNINTENVYIVHDTVYVPVMPVNSDKSDGDISEEPESEFDDDISISFTQYESGTPDEMVLSDEDFHLFENKYKILLAKHFSKSQLKSIKHIHIVDCEAFSMEGDNNIAGYCQTYDKLFHTYSDITIACRNDIDEYNLLHECFHALYYKHKKLFDSKYLENWKQCNDFVSNYAKESLEEDFAETGATYLKYGFDGNDNAKLKLIADFYHETY